MILLVSLPSLLAWSACRGAGGEGGITPLNTPCGAVCDELSGAWSATVQPSSSMMIACSDPQVNQTTVTFPSDAIGLGEVEISRSNSGRAVEFQSTSSPFQIAGTVDLDTFGVIFTLGDGGGLSVRCAGLLQKFSNPAGSEGFSAQTNCDIGSVGSAECQLDPPMKTALLIQRILMEAPPIR